MEGIVHDVDTCVRAHRQGLSHGFGGALRAHGDDGHLATVRLGDLQCFFDRVFVKFVQHPVGRGTIQGRIFGLECFLRPGIGHLLHAHRDFHGSPCSPSLGDRAA